jgi:uncharacterized protein
MPEAVLITGGTGLIGKALAEQLIEQGYVVHCLSRSAKKHPVDGVRTFVWDVQKGTIDTKSLEGVTTIVHLAGAGVVDETWTEARKKEIIDSRVHSAKLLELTLASNPNTIKRIVSASAIGYYANSRRQLNENSAGGNDFPALVCKAWEQAAKELAGSARELVIIRIGIVLSKDGGAFPKLAGPVKFGVGTWLGSGNQVLSWVHIRDLVHMFHFGIANADARGIYNGVANEPCSQKFFLKQVARYYHRLLIPGGVPGWVLKIAMGERAQIVLEGPAVITQRLLAEGFTYKFPHLYEALRDLCRDKK